MAFSIFGKRVVIIEDDDDSQTACKKCALQSECFDYSKATAGNIICKDEYGESNRYFEYADKLK